MTNYKTTTNLEQTPEKELPKSLLVKELQGRRKCTLSEKMISLLLRQLYKELYNHNLYMSFSNGFGIKGFAVLEEYYKKRAEEEKHHSSGVINYLTECDAPIKYPSVPAIEQSWTNEADPFRLTVDAEIETTAMIYELVELALEEGDWTTFNGLHGTDDNDGRLVIEQREEESISRTALDIAESEGSWLRKEKSIMNAYKKDTD